MGISQEQLRESVRWVWWPTQARKQGCSGPQRPVTVRVDSSVFMTFWLVLAAYTCSGLAGLVYEVSWSRALRLAMGHALPASSTVLASFMGGLALGAVGGGRIALRLSARDALRADAALELVAAVLAVAIPYELQALSPLFVSAYQDGQGGLTFALIRLLACLLLLLLPAM